MSMTINYYRIIGGKPKHSHSQIVYSVDENYTKKCIRETVRGMGLEVRSLNRTEEGYIVYMMEQKKW